MVNINDLIEEDDILPEPPAQRYCLQTPIKPYVCSTPDDFVEEREFLVKHVFPQLQEYCVQRGGCFDPVDIRWRSHDDQIATGNLLSVSLQYILQCAPFFICLLGESYGPFRPVESPKLPTKVKRIPDYVTALDKNFFIAAMSGFTWVLQEAQQNTSVTELEIIQAAFLSDNQHCHFYFRQPEHLDVKFGHLDPEQRELCSRVHLPQNEYADLNIRDLKQRIVKKGLPVKYFRTNEELGAHILKDWKEVVDIVYPALDYPIKVLETEEYKEWVSHETFAASRQKVFVASSELKGLMLDMTTFAKQALDDPPQEEPELIDRHRQYSIVNKIKKREPSGLKYKSIMLIHGDRGSGKSSLIANWLPKFYSECREVKVLRHFVSSSYNSTDVTVFMKQCIKEMREEYMLIDDEPLADKPSGDNEDEPWTFQEICQAFLSAIKLGPCVLVLDGMDELGVSLGHTIRQVKEFAWLPVPLPPQCKIICTTCRSDVSYHSMAMRRDATSVSMPLLETVKVRTHFMEDYLQDHYDYLHEEQLELLQSMKSIRKPVYLNLLCNELRTFNVYMNIVNYVDDVYDNCSNLRELCSKTVQRWTKDYSWQKENLYGDAPDSEPELEYDGWVPDLLRLLLVSKTGLLPAELFSMLLELGYTGSRMVKNYDWLQFRLCVGNLFCHGLDGLITFSHQHVKEITEYILLIMKKDTFRSTGTDAAADADWKEEKKKFHSLLAKMFLRQKFSQRVLMELPWQYMMAGDKESLLRIVKDPIFLDGFLNCQSFPSNRSDLASYWTFLKDQGYDMANTYTEVLVRAGVLETALGEIPASPQSCDEDMDSLSVSTGEGTEPLSPRPMTPKLTVTSPRERTLSVIEEASVAGSYTDFEKIHATLNGLGGAAGMREEGSQETHRQSPPLIQVTETGDEELETIFLTETADKEDKPFGCGKAAISMSLRLSFLLAKFLKDFGHSDMMESVVQAIANKLNKSFPLERTNQLLYSQVQESLGLFALERKDIDHAQKCFRQSLKIVMDMSELEEDSDYVDIMNLKGRILNHLGYLRMQEGIEESAEDLLKEGLECVSVTHNQTVRATILYNLGLLRTRQTDYILAESNLEQAQEIREQLYGKSHPLVADVIHAHADIVAQPYNPGHDVYLAENLYRKALKIREECLGKSHNSVADTLFQIGKLLKDEITYAAKNEAVDLLKRALDIRTSHLGGDHVDTRAVRAYLNKLEVSLKMGRYEFGPAKPMESRTTDRPYSKMSWRDKDIANFERRAKKRATSSRSGSSVGSRPGSSKYDPNNQLGRNSSLSFLSASEKLLMESERPRLLNREAVDRRLRQSSAKSTRTQDGGEDASHEDKKHMTLEINLNTEDNDGLETRVTHDKIDSFADDIGVMDESTLAKTTKQVRPFQNTELANGKAGGGRFGSAGSSRAYTPQQIIIRPNGRINSAKSLASTTLSVGRASRTTHASAKSIRSVKTPFDINSSNTLTVTSGPNADISSLLGPPQSPRDIRKEIHHKSAWYHVPGRYQTSEKFYPPKRSQKTLQAHDYEQLYLRTITPGFIPRRKNISRMSSRAPESEGQVLSDHNNFGPTVKGLEPVMNGYDLDNRTDPTLLTEDNQDSSNAHATVSVKFKDSVVIK